MRSEDMGASFSYRSLGFKQQGGGPNFAWGVSRKDGKWWVFAPGTGLCVDLPFDTYEAAVLWFTMVETLPPSKETQ